MAPAFPGLKKEAETEDITLCWPTQVDNIKHHTAGKHRVI